MKVWPVLLDSAPAYLKRGDEKTTLFSAPMGQALLATELCQLVERVTADVPTIVAPRNAPPDYRNRMSAAYPRAAIATTAKELAAILRGAETSDILFFVDPRCLPVDESQLVTMMTAAIAQPQVAWHLVAFTADLAGTRESVNVDDDGVVQSVHRYYNPTTWPFIAGIAASFVPVTSRVLPLQAVPDSLHALRQLLVSRGVPFRDVAVEHGAFDLAEEHGLLAAVEASVREAAEAAHDGDGYGVVLAPDVAIDRSARLVGPIIVQSGARIDAGATIVGPALIGADAHVGARAIVAHAALGVGAVVADDSTLRDRAWFSSVPASAEQLNESVPQTFTQRLARFAFETVDTMAPVASPDSGPQAYRIVKRVFDAVAAAVALLVLSPVLLVVAALVRLDSKGPVFFRHTREGVGERPFDCIKFRTMRVGANALQRKLKAQDKLDGPHFKMDADPRITRLGRWLRTTNIDELPQLFNVLKGDMSLVGPRPSPFRENQICVPWRYGRLSVRPGITGLWQVCRQDRAAGDFHQWIEYDLLYVQHMSLMLDLKVLVATVYTLGGKFPVPVSRLVDIPARPAEKVTREVALPVTAVKESLRHGQR